MRGKFTEDLIKAAREAVKWSRENAIPGNPSTIRRLAALVNEFDGEQENKKDRDQAKRIRKYGLLTVIYEDSNEDGYDTLITFEYAGSMGDNKDSMNKCLQCLNMAPIIDWKDTYPNWEESGSPDYFYTISFKV